MKEAIGGSWLFVLVITLITLFTTFVSVTTNYTRTYKVKDQLISIIEIHNGVDQDTLEEISRYLSSIGYGATGKCPNDDGNGWVPFTSNNTLGAAGWGDDANYCIYKHVVACRAVQTDQYAGKDIHSSTIKGQGMNTFPRAYYGVATFFRIDWPILRYFINLKVTGETSILYLTNGVDADIAELGSNNC